MILFIKMVDLFKPRNYLFIIVVIFTFETHSFAFINFTDLVEITVILQFVYLILLSYSKVQLTIVRKVHLSSDVNPSATFFNDSRFLSRTGLVSSGDRDCPQGTHSSGKRRYSFLLQFPLRLTILDFQSSTPQRTLRGPTNETCVPSVTSTFLYTPGVNKLFIGSQV